MFARGAEFEKRVEKYEKATVKWVKALKSTLSHGSALFLLENVSRLLQRKQRETEQLLKGKISYRDVYAEVWRVPPPTPSEIAGRGYMLDSWAETALALLAAHTAALRFAGTGGKTLLRNFVVAIQGRRGTGKTTYSVWAITAAMYRLGMRPEDALEYTRSFIAWSFEDAVAILEALHRNRAWVPAIVFDDAGMWLTKYWMFRKEDRKSMIALSKLLDTVKDWCGIIVLTTPFFDKLASFIKEFSDYVVFASTVNDRGAIMNEFKWAVKAPSKAPHRTLAPSQVLYIDLTPPDALMPDDIWAKMLETREKLREQQLADLSEALYDAYASEQAAVGDEEELFYGGPDGEGV